MHLSKADKKFISNVCERLYGPKRRNEWQKMLKGIPIIKADKTRIVIYPSFQEVMQILIDKTRANIKEKQNAKKDDKDTTIVSTTQGS